MVGRFQHVATLAGEKASFIRPEIMAIPPETLAAWMKLPALADYRLMLDDGTAMANEEILKPLVMQFIGTPFVALPTTASLAVVRR